MLRACFSTLTHAFSILLPAVGGAGAVLGAARALGGLAPAGVSCHFVIASCENMIGSRGLRPGDILTASNGKTIEVNNTDAEGRLTLADALIYAQRTAGVTRVVDIATLTGACMVALGNGIAGMWTPHDTLAASLSDASAAAGEKLWRMPLEDAYWEHMSSPIADMKNTGMGKGGAITAALFLREFVEKGTEWAHLDIAGPVVRAPEVPIATRLRVLTSVRCPFCLHSGMTRRAPPASRPPRWPTGCWRTPRSRRNAQRVSACVLLVSYVNANLASAACVVRSTVTTTR